MKLTDIKTVGAYCYKEAPVLVDTVSKGDVDGTDGRVLIRDYFEPRRKPSWVSPDEISAWKGKKV